MTNETKKILEGFELVGDLVELFDEPVENSVQVYAKDYHENGVKVIKYISVDDTSGKVRHFEALKDPEKLSESERKEVLDYVLGEIAYDDTESVSPCDLFIHGKFIRAIS